MYLVIALSSMVSAIVFSDRETITSRLLAGLFAVITLSAAIMTVYRASFVGFGAFILVAAFAGRDMKKTIAALSVLALTALAIAFMYQPMWDKLLATSSFTVRLYIWDYALSVFSSSPLTGAGLDHFACLIPKGIPDAGQTYYDAHSVYLNVMAQTGLIGLAAVVMIMAGFLRAFFRSHPVTGFGLSLKYGGLGAFLVVFAGGIFDTTLHHEHAVLFSLLTGLFIAHARLPVPAAHDACSR